MAGAVGPGEAVWMVISSLYGHYTLHYTNQQHLLKLIHITMMMYVRLFIQQNGVRPIL